MKKNFFLLAAWILVGQALAQPSTATAQSAQHPVQLRLDGAISRATEILNKGVTNYPEHRSCFSCHHQALPLLANSIGNVQRAESRRSFYDRQLTRDVAQFTDRAFSGKRKSLNAAGEIGGKALTVAYGLWALDLSGEPENETTRAMVEYLLKTQADDGAWNFQSLRPPAASSRAMTSAVAVYGLRAYAHGVVDEDRIRIAYHRALAWSQLLGEPASHEDLIGQIWLEYMLHNELGMDEFLREQHLQDKLWKSQRKDGGWAQTAELASDAYATGQALTLLAEVFYVTKKPLHTGEGYQRGIHFLLDTQQADGSWLVKTRSKPVQVFFDNGDPHGENQFISMMATSWATAALREYTQTTYCPLESPRVTTRLTNRRQR